MVVRASCPRGQLWDVGGAPGMHLDNNAKIILRRYYSFSAEARKILVMPFAAPEDDPAWGVLLEGEYRVVGSSAREC